MAAWKGAELGLGVEGLDTGWAPLDMGRGPTWGAEGGPGTALNVGCAPEMGERGDVRSCKGWGLKE